MNEYLIAIFGYICFMWFVLAIMIAIKRFEKWVDFVSPPIKVENFKKPPVVGVPYSLNKLKKNLRRKIENVDIVKFDSEGNII